MDMTRISETQMNRGLDSSANRKKKGVARSSGVWMRAETEKKIKKSLKKIKQLHNDKQIDFYRLRDIEEKVYAKSLEKLKLQNQRATIQKHMKNLEGQIKIEEERVSGFRKLIEVV